jgi:hypothetical protein
VCLAERGERGVNQLLEELGPTGLTAAATLVAAAIAATAALVSGLVKAFADDVLAKRRSYRSYRQEMVRSSMKDAEDRIRSLTAEHPDEVAAIYQNAPRPHGRRLYLTPDDDLGEIAASYAFMDYMFWRAVKDGVWEKMSPDSRQAVLADFTRRAMIFRQALEEFVFGGREARKLVRRNRAAWKANADTFKQLLVKHEQQVGSGRDPVSDDIE